MSIALVVAGHTIPQADRLIARYCGLTGEQWAYRFYDCVPVERQGVTDLLAAAVMHGPLRRADLQWFADNRPAMLDLLDRLPDDLALDEATVEAKDALAEGVRAIADGDPRTAGLLTKILHRHRPALVAIDERDVGRLFAQARRQRGRLPYRRLLDELALALGDNRDALRDIRQIVEPRLGDRPTPTSLRLLDIAIWMDANA